MANALGVESAGLAGSVGWAGQVPRVRAGRVCALEAQNELQSSWNHVEYVRRDDLK